MKVRRRRGERTASAVDVDVSPREQVIVALADVRAAIDELDAIAGRLARSFASVEACPLSAAAALIADVGRPDGALSGRD